PVLADCALIAVTALARFWTSAPAAVPVLVTLMFTPPKVKVEVPTAVAVTADVPVATVASAVALRPAIPAELIAFVITLASVERVPRLYTVPGPVSVTVNEAA